MAAALRKIMPDRFPDFRELEHWIVIPHQGKSDLERSYPRKMRTWRAPGVRFIILRDNDGADCLKLKQRLVSLVPNQAPEYLVRIVCQELEGWLLGDMDAVAAAYPAAARHLRFRSLSNNDPDKMTNVADLMKNLTGTEAKVARAAAIAEQMKPAANRSHSFQVFVNGLRKFLSE